MANISITNVGFSAALTAQQTVTVQYRLTSDPDDPGSYILVTNAALVNVDGTLVNPVNITGLLPLTSYTVWIYNNCGGQGAKRAFITEAPTCPTGYTLSPDGTYCYQITSVPADYVGGESPYIICRNQNDVYSTFPCQIMKWVDDAPGYNTAGVPLAGAAYNPVAISSGTLWFNQPTGGHGSPTIGPLNRAGIWPCDGAGNPCENDCPPDNTDVGFSKQIIVPETKVYYVGFGVDNFATLEIQDSTGSRLIFTQDAAAIGTYFSAGSDVVFKSWLIYPVLLNAGPTIISMTGQNDSTGSPAVMGVEVYNNTESQLISATTESDLNYIFSTNPDLGFVTIHDSFEEGNYSCAAYPGSSLTYNAGPGTYTCDTIVTVPPTS